MTPKVPVTNVKVPVTTIFENAREVFQLARENCGKNGREICGLARENIRKNAREKSKSARDTIHQKVCHGHFGVSREKKHWRTSGRYSEVATALRLLPLKALAQNVQD